MQFEYYNNKKKKETRDPIPLHVLNRNCEMLFPNYDSNIWYHTLCTLIY